MKNNKNVNVNKIVYKTFYKSNIIQPLKGFCTVVENNCSIVKASNVLYLTTSTINKQISSLENKLNIKLFQKTLNRKNGNYIELTKDGKEFYDKIKIYIEKFDSILEEYLKNKKEKKEKILKIGTTTALISKFIPFIHDFQKNNLNIEVDFNVYDRNTAMELLINDELDIFISTIEDNEKLDDKINFEKIKRYTPYLVLYKGHKLANKNFNKITKNDIVNCDLIFNENGLTSNDLQNFIKNNNLTSVMKADDLGIEDIKCLIRNKVGIFIIFDIFLDKTDSKTFVLKDASNILFGGYCGCFFKKHLELNKNIFTFFNFLEDKKDKIFIL